MQPVVACQASKWREGKQNRSSDSLRKKAIFSTFQVQKAGKTGLSDSPSFQAGYRGFESRLPLHGLTGCSSLGAYFGNNILDSDSEYELPLDVDMTWAQPQYSRREVNQAGETLLALLQGGRDVADSARWNHALDIVDNFRAAHAFPLNTIQISLRRQARIVDRNVIVAQRLKRLFSIYMKLDRFKKMQLWDMQDIGGCRAIVQTVSNVNQLTEAYKESKIRHARAHEDNYITCPRESGYRSRHLVLRYYSDRSEVFNGMKVEVQIRTHLQHSWATTVETVDAFTSQALKSSRGRRDWERFFQLMGTANALHEGTEPVPKTPTTWRELVPELRSYADTLRVKTTLEGFTTAFRETRNPSVRNADYYLLKLDSAAESLTISGYERKELPQAAREYADIEKQIRAGAAGDAVLVSVDSLNDLERAYPNYFADTRSFIEELEHALKA
ncbi:MAG: RelA/SpoT domain-containing protein [Chloroflexi bacterium]|nr:RelA/SpoT domain-containing protein [Chloroflexota bacterium]